jgi:hypothetical protein
LLHCSSNRHLGLGDPARHAREEDTVAAGSVQVGLIGLGALDGGNMGWMDGGGVSVCVCAVCVCVYLLCVWGGVVEHNGSC